MPYFDGCYFDPTYFDASECIAPPTPSGGKAGHGATRPRRLAQRIEPDPILLDDEEAILVLEGF